MQEVQRLESLGVLAGGIAHDFNNLLAVILGNAALLESGATSGSPAEGRIQRIQAAARHAEGLTDQMLAYAGKSVSELLPLDLSSLVRETGELLRASVSPTCRLELDLAESLGPVEGDETQLRQVLLNLVINASEALGEAGGSVHIRTARIDADRQVLAQGYGAPERPPGTWLMLEVADDGPGIDGALRSRIFEPFYSTKRSGRGLGLAAVLGIAGAHRGVLTLETAPGEGSVFRLLLPPGRGVHAARDAGASATGSDSCFGRVLVVDDDEGVREVAQAFLERGGFTVESSPGGREALDRLRNGGPPVDAVLLDLAMPGFSGDEVLRALRDEWPELPVVVASGYKRDLAAERVGEDVAFVKKPYDPDALIAALRGALGGDGAAAPALS